MNRLTAAVLAFGLVLGGRAAHAAWEAEQWLTAGFGSVALVGAAVIILFITSLRQAARERARHQDEIERLGRDIATFKDALARAPTLLLFWPRDEPEAAPIKTSETSAAPFKGEAVERLDDLAKHLDAKDFALLKAALATLTSGGHFRQACKSADGSRTLEAIANADHRGVCLSLSDISEHRQAVATLEAQVHATRGEVSGLALVPNTVAMPMWRRNPSLELVWCNDAYAYAVEATPADAVKAPGIELIATLPGADSRTLAKRAKTEGQTVGVRYHIVVRGARRLLELNEAPVEGGGTVGWARDVTGLEEAESALKSHVAGHAEVLESLSAAIAIYAANGRLNFFNAEFTKLFELDELFLRTEPTVSEVIDAMRDQRRLPEQADSLAYKARLQRLFTSVTEPSEELLHLPDGSVLRQVVTPHPFGGLLFITQDVTDRFALERSHSTLAAVQRATLDNLYEAVAVFGADGRLKLWNPGYAAIWSLDAHRLGEEPHVNEILDLIEGHFTRVDFDIHRREFITQLENRARANQRLLRRDGKVFDCAFVPLPDGASLVSYLDISDSFQVEHALRERTEALETADRLKSEFVANVSYELRTPLNTVIGFTEILVNQYFGPLNERQLEYARGVLESSQQLLSLINDILDLATIEAGLIVLEIEPVDVHGVMASMLNLVQESARKQRSDLVLDCPRSIGRLDADERRLKQVLYNLLSNALKFTPAGGKITLGARREETTMTIWVADTGIGIERDEQKNVFEKFRRGRSPLARQSGAGLGLSLVRYFVELHGGELVLESQPDIGTTVTCIFPLAQTTEAGASQPVN